MRFYGLFKAVCIFLCFFVSNISRAIPIDIVSGEVSSASYQYLGPTDFNLFNIGLYEPDNEHGWKYINGTWISFRERGVAELYIEGQHGVSFGLALGSYEPTDWVLTGPGIASLKEILLYGYHHHTVTGYLFGTVINEKTYESGLGYIYSEGAYNWPNGAKNKIENFFGAPITSFVGAYSASEFIIRENPYAVVPEPPSLFLMLVGIFFVLSRVAARRLHLVATTNDAAW